MDAAITALGDFIRARRSLLDPESMGIGVGSGRRRVAGLRREEVAELAGISSQYYLRLEQGRGHQPSYQVLRAIARALRLDEHELDYLLRLTRQAGGVRMTEPAAHPTEAIDSLMRLLEHWGRTPAFVVDHNQDVVLSTGLARALGGRMLTPGSNFVISLFELGAGEGVRSRSATWGESARAAVSDLRYHGDPRSPRFQEVVGTLAVRHPEFRTMWAAHDAHPFVSSRFVWSGRDDAVELDAQAFEVSGSGGHVLVTLRAESGSHSARVLDRLGRHGNAAHAPAGWAGADQLRTAS